MFFRGLQYASNISITGFSFILSPSSANTYVLYISRPCFPIHVKNIDVLILSGFSSDSVAVIYNRNCCFHRSHCSEIFPLKTSGSGRRNLFILTPCNDLTTRLRIQNNILYHKSYMPTIYIHRQTCSQAPGHNNDHDRYLVF